MSKTITRPQFQTQTQNQFQSQTKTFFPTTRNLNYTHKPQDLPTTPILEPESTMQFVSRNGKLRFNEISNLDLSNIIRTNNFPLLEQFAENLIFSDIETANIENKDLKRLLHSFQYSLEYLNHKQLSLETLNDSIENDYYELRKESYILEEKLKKNKLTIKKNAKAKKERQMLLTTYKSIIDFNTQENNEEAVNIILNKPKDKTRRFYCHICSGKGFSTEDKLESHMKRRHLHSKELEENQSEESFVDYSRRIEEMKTHFEGILKQQEEEEMKKRYTSDLEKMKRENENKMKMMEDKLKETLEDFKAFITKTTLEYRNQPPPEVKIEMPQQNGDTVSKEDILKITNSIADMNKIIRANYDNKMDSMMKEINELKNRPPAKEKIIYQNIPKGKQEIVIKEEPPQRKERDDNIENIPKKEEDISLKKSTKVEIQKEEIFSPESSLKESQKEIISEIDNQIKESKENINNSQKQIESLNSLNASMNFQRNSLGLKLGSSHRSRNSSINDKLLPNPPKLENFKSQDLKTNRKYKPIVIKRDMSKTMTENDKLDEFFANFMNRDNELFEKEFPEAKDIGKKIIPENVEQNNDAIEQRLNKTLKKTKKNLEVDNIDLENKTKQELINIIDKTLKNIDEVNNKNAISQLYYDTVQKAINLKLYEVEKNEIKKRMEEQQNEGKLKRNKTKSSKASEVIKEANDFFE